MIVIIFCILFFIPAFLVEIFTCYPLAAEWDLTVHGKCVNYTIYLVIFLAIELFLDALILVLPLREIAGLRMAFQKKILISLIFLLGIL